MSIREPLPFISLFTDSFQSVSQEHAVGAAQQVCSGLGRETRAPQRGWHLQSWGTAAGLALQPHGPQPETRRRRLCVVGGRGDLQGPPRAGVGGVGKSCWWWGGGFKEQSGI